MNSAALSNGGGPELGQSTAGIRVTTEADHAKRINLLNELFSTETRYVGELCMIVRRVAGAWSPTNFPPPELDSMFRASEVLYRVNNEFLRSLQEIGPNPTSPKGLGSLLMQWVDKLQTPYTRFCSVRVHGLDALPNIQQNKELFRILSQVTAEIPPTNGGVWTLDALFDLPIARIGFYKKFYARLLRNTEHGRSDHALLQSANEKLDNIFLLAQQRASAPTQPPVYFRALSPPPAPAPALALASASASAPAPILAPPAARVEPAPYKQVQLPPQSSNPIAAPPIGINSSAPAPVLSHQNPAQNAYERTEDRSRDQETARQPPAPAPARPPQSAEKESTRAALTSLIPQLSVTELQGRIDSSYTMDIFTLQPKTCRLHINPSTLTFPRSVRLTDGALMQIRPPNGIDTRTVNNARLILFTDLLLIGEDIDRAENPLQPPNVWLMFPPLAGKFVDATSHGAPHENTIRITIMRRTELLIRLPSAECKQKWLHEIVLCRDFKPVQRAESGSSAAPLATLPTPLPALERASQPNTVPDEPNRTLSLPLPMQSMPSPADMSGGSLTSNAARMPQRLPPLLVPNVTANEQLLGSSLVEQDADLRSPSLPSAHLTRESSLNSIDSFPRMPARSRMDSPEIRVASPLGSPLTASPTASVVPKPLGALDEEVRSMRITNSPLSQKFPIMSEQARRPSEPSIPSNAQQSPVRSMSQPRLNAMVGAKLPSQTLQEGGRQATPDWLHHEPAPASAAQKQRRPAYNLCAQMRCKVFLKQSYAQWKALGNARLRLYHLQHTKENQLVVGSDKKTIISTIVLTNAVERVGKTGLAVELSDNGRLTGVVYMLHMRSEESANGLFHQLIIGSSRTLLGSPTPSS
ncbi:hypothetical protein MVES1_002558 [Malassezia vespertilionis]|uniref:uncharacterized protein n=1 Tax=Malassezia vespertilionis TaxID=2020962 RepID=UPI0024B1EAE4|nr:uncharacterized protein MVES1_002558 [Malassezia vespertilionis]WFD07199.1 hypothetical protein MVES1_002558 [Malassezia vespertilionis]